MNLPDPTEALGLDDLVTRLRQLKAHACDQSYASIARTVNRAWRRAGRPEAERTNKSTVAGYFTYGRRRLDEDLLVAVVTALHPEPDYPERWRHALRAIRGDAAASMLADTRSGLPEPATAPVGRRRESKALERLLRRRGPVVVCGMAGAGKTALALHAAHHAAAADPGVRIQLSADLCGSDPARPPAAAGAVLAGFLRHLGVPAHQIPHDFAARVDTYRALTEEVPALVFLDDAADEDAVEALIPAGRDSRTVITSRHRLSGLRDAEHVPLGALDSHDAITLLRGAAGADRVDADPAAANWIAARVGRHPGALASIAAYLRARPDWRLADCAQPVAVALAGGLRTALAVSVARLPVVSRRVLGLLALHPGTDIGEDAVAALTELPPADTRTHLATLTRAHLVRTRPDGRFSLPELVREHLRELVELEEPASLLEAARIRLFDYYRETAAEAVSVLNTSHPRPVGAILPTPDDAGRWMAAEYANLLLVTAADPRAGTQAERRRFGRPAS
ncbi:hypothetical protein AB0I28_30480 [Phytomonospora sp. NPDC050363]|uniref:hypothetical protein n=1 Tax=Phytomonospora sp. NPDC050363 TaxID=3155642 RepID=UPI0033F7AC32